MFGCTLGQGCGYKLQWLEAEHRGTTYLNKDGERVMLVTVRLDCVSDEAAEAVVEEHKGYFGTEAANTIGRDGNQVVVQYFDERWPREIVEWAGKQGHVSGESVARFLTSL
jgi:hypothetical protein